MATIARKKAWKPKSKTGCITCRIRRIKCGEEKPQCLRCTKTGRTCDGYDSKPQEASSAAVTATQALAVQSAARPVRSLSTSVEGDAQELRSFHFFLDRTAPELAGYYESKFWSGLVLQRCYSDPAVRHAVIALGALHESYKFGDIKLLEDGSIDDPRQRFALVQNSKAIHHLTGHLSHGGTPKSAEVILISCLLFICFEAMQGNYQAAFLHLNSGLKILGDWIERTKRNSQPHQVSNPTQEFVENELMPLFSTLDIQTTAILPTSSLQWGNASGLHKVDFRTDKLPGSFSTLNEARICLENRTHWILKYHYSITQKTKPLLMDPATTSVPDIFMRAVLEEKNKQANGLELWSQGFDTFMQRIRPSMDTDDLRASLSIKLYHITVKLILESALFGSEMEYDRFMPEFELITSLANTFVQSCGSSTPENGRVYSFNTAIVPPLLCVVCKCRDPAIRRRAHGFLVTSLRREGGWDSDYASSLGRWTIDKEEEGLEQVSSAEQVLEPMRIGIEEISWQGRRRALVKFRQGPRRLVTGDSQLKEEWIMW